MNTYNGPDENRRVGILSFPNSTSHGAVLQMYALYETIEEMGYCPVVINYHNAHMRRLKHTSVGQNSVLCSMLRRTMRRLIHGKAYRGFQRFEMTMTHDPEKPFSDPARLSALAPSCRAVICGSDQVWNPNITDYDISYFLSFCGPETNRIAYAPSFGFTDFPADYDAAIARELCSFAALSVREKQGEVKIKALLGRKPEMVLDPTFLIPETQWEALETPCEVPERYILHYSLHHTEEIMRICTQLAREKQLPIIVAGGNLFSNRKAGAGVRYMPDTDPRQWLYLVRHASYVVTNSFHGLAFSIIFRRNFFLGMTSQTNARLENLVSLLELERQIIQEGMLLDNTDYTAAETILPEMRNRSLQFLKRALDHE